MHNDRWFGMTIEMADMAGWSDRLTEELPII
jgi:hypothetical protein